MNKGENNAMKKLLFVVIICSMLSICACGGKNVSIVGLWEPDDYSESPLEFFEGGIGYEHSSKTDFSKGHDFNYKLSDSTIMLTNGWSSLEFRYKLSGDVLELTDKDKTLTYYRVKSKGSAPKGGVDTATIARYNEWKRLENCSFLSNTVEEKEDGFYYCTVKEFFSEKGKQRLWTNYTYIITYKWNYANKKWVFYDYNCKAEYEFDLVGDYSFEYSPGYWGSGKAAHGHFTVSAVDYTNKTANISYTVSYGDWNDSSSGVYSLEIDRGIMRNEEKCTIDILNFQNNTNYGLRLVFWDTDATAYVSYSERDYKYYNLVQDK